MESDDCDGNKLLKKLSALDGFLLFSVNQSHNRDKTKYEEHKETV